jgi:hypothetical protein
MSKSWSRDMDLSPGTFGNSPACHILVDLMNKGVIKVYDKHRVLSFISTASLEFKAIATIQNAGVRGKVMWRSRDYYTDRVDKELSHLPLLFVNLLKNVINHLVKRYLKEATRTVAGSNT